MNHINYQKLTYNRRCLADLAVLKNLVIDKTCFDLIFTLFYAHNYFLL